MTINKGIFRCKIHSLFFQCQFFGKFLFCRKSSHIFTHLQLGGCFLSVFRYSNSFLQIFCQIISKAKNVMINFRNRICIKKGSSFLGDGGGGRTGGEIEFSLFWCSHHVLCVFSHVHSDISQVLNVFFKGVPSSTMLLSHMVLPKRPPFSAIQLGQR